MMMDNDQRFDSGGRLKEGKPAAPTAQRISSTDQHSLAGADDQAFELEGPSWPLPSAVFSYPASSTATELLCLIASSMMRRSATAAASDRPLSQK
jgi:hypothetical protein